jgi:hypothetical protein
MHPQDAQHNLSEKSPTSEKASSFRQTLSQTEWQAAQAAHRAQVAEWAQQHVQRASRGIRHPVYDFLFEYYSFRPAHLMRWTPGVDVLLEDTTPQEQEWRDDFVETHAGAYIPAERFPQHRIEYLRWATRYLSAVAQRPPSFCCFGLHEWAMVYKCEAPRHTQQKLRFAPEKIQEIVEASDVRCTHFDAFRFFTPAAVPRNRFALSRETTTAFDQRGCIHVTMDLYRFAHKIAPWCPSDLIAETFLTAVDARTIDMRASPYDIAHLGFEAIPIEEPTGRELYMKEQRRLAERAAPLRQRLIDIHTHILSRHPSVSEDAGHLRVEDNQGRVSP